MYQYLTLFEEIYQLLGLKHLTTMQLPDKIVPDTRTWNNMVCGDTSAGQYRCVPWAYPTLQRCPAITTESIFKGHTMDGSQKTDQH